MAGQSLKRAAGSIFARDFVAVGQNQIKHAMSFGGIPARAE
jgi:hypothetical protein